MAWELVGDVTGPTIWDSIVNSDEEVLAVWEDVAGFRPIVRESVDQLIARAYWQGASRVYEGAPEFDPEVWFTKGANWCRIAERVHVWRVGTVGVVTTPALIVLAAREGGRTLDVRALWTISDCERRFGAKAERVD
jgi:hypothetical protein